MSLLLMKCNDESCSSSSSSVSARLLGSMRRDKNLRKRERHRARRLLEANLDAAEGSTFLEGASVKPVTGVMYQKELEMFLAWALTMGVRLGAGEEVDNALTSYFNNLFAQGFQPHRGEKCLAGLLHRDPCFSKQGKETGGSSMEEPQGLASVVSVAQSPSPPPHDLVRSLRGFSSSRPSSDGSLHSGVLVNISVPMR